MSCTKTPSEGQMGSGESDDEFYNVKLPNAASVVNQCRESKKEPVKKVYSPPRTKVKYDYKFESSSDDDSDDGSSQRRYKAEPKESSAIRGGGGGGGHGGHGGGGGVPNEKTKKEERSKLSQNTCKVVEKINEELKSMKNGSKGKFEKSDGPPQLGSKHIPTSTVGVLPPPPPVVMVPPPMIVPQPPSVMAVGASGMIVPPAMGLGNQNSVMLPHANMLTGNVMQGANSVSGIMGTSGSGLMGMGNPNMMQSQGSVVGMTNDLLRLQGNIMGITAPGNMMQIPGNVMNTTAVAGLCMTGNMLQMQGNLMGMQGAGATSQALISNPGSIPSSIITSPGGVMMSNPANVMTVMNAQGSMMGNPGNMMLNMNNLVNKSQTSRINFPGSASNAAANAGTGRNAVSDAAKHSYASDARSKSSERDSDRIKALSSKSPVSFSPSDSECKNWHGNGDGDGDGDEDEDDSKSSSESNKTRNSVRDIPNTFKNDGSFMELFKKMSQANNNSKGTSNKIGEGSASEKSGSDPSSVKKPPPPVILSGIVGKRRGGRVLKTGLVKKVKKLNDSEEEKGPKDAWAMYMAEVKKYREASCEEEGKTRPLVK